MLILQASPVRPLTKTITANILSNGTIDYRIGQYDAKVTHFSARDVNVLSFDDLVTTLNKLIIDKTSCVVRGALKHGIDPTFFMRRKISNPQGGAIEDVDQQWLCIDIDSFPLAGLGSVAKAPEILRSMLPVCFAKAACWWNFSPSQGYKDKDTVSIHLWFWLDDAISNAELKQYFSLFNESFKEIYGVPKFVDIVLYDSIQIHYTAPPDIVGVDDVLPVRHGMLPGEPSVKITDDWIRDSRLDTGAVQKYVSRIGSDKDGFHSPILSASAAWVRAYGVTTKGTEEFKALIRDTVSRAEKEGYGDEKISRYISDTFLDGLIRSASEKGFDKGAVLLDGRATSFFNNFIYVATAAKFFQADVQDWISPHAFDLIARPFLKMTGGGKVFIDAGGAIADYVWTIPGEPPLAMTTIDGKRIYNKWRGRRGIKLNKYDIRPWEEHIAFLADHRPAETKLTLDFLAYIMANPGKKVAWVPVLGSRTGGTGKSIIKIPLRQIFNGGMSEIGSDDIKNQFNGYVEKELVVVEEIYGPDNRMMVNQFKAKLTEESSRVNIKGVPQYDAPNFCNYIMFTNHEIPFPIDQGDRRFFFMFSESLPKEQSYYEELAKWLKASTDIIYSWAHDRDLTTFNAYAAPIETTEKQAVLRSSIGGINQKLLIAQSESSWPLQHDIITAPELLYALNSGSRWQMNAATLDMEIKRLGMQNLGPINRGKLGRKTYWSVRNHEAIKKMTNEEIIEAIGDKIIGDEKSWYSSSSI